ncbi:MAG TPA: hypothetical protein DD782_02390, partial [Firmicutes bacterium]|nr:hypothetical protein [Bacillota bacterium]
GIEPALADLHYALGTAGGVTLVYQRLDVNERLALKTIVFSASERGVDSTAVWQAVNRNEG